MKKISQALISVSDKHKLKKVLQTLKKFKIKVISSGGTYKEIKRLGFKCKNVSSFTEFPEILDGRVKTLHPKIHAGILNKRSKKSHKLEMKSSNFENIDLVIVNFYPFEKTLIETKNHDKIVENIDVGGPTMVRAAAKNYNDVTVITKKNQYEDLIRELNENKGSTSFNFRQKMSEEAFTETAFYDVKITNYFLEKNKTNFPSKKVISANLIEKLRYGENPHQSASIYSYSQSINLEQLHGKKLSYNNYNDIYAALRTSKSLPRDVGIVIVKHANPCGVSSNKSPLISFQNSKASDPVSAFGGVVACNFRITFKIAAEINKSFFEVILAKGFDKKALSLLKKKKNMRIIDITSLKEDDNLKIKTFTDSFLIQDKDELIIKKTNL